MQCIYKHVHINMTNLKEPVLGRPRSCYKCIASSFIQEHVEKLASEFNELSRITFLKAQNELCETPNRNTQDLDRHQIASLSKITQHIHHHPFRHTHTHIGRI